MAFGGMGKPMRKGEESAAGVHPLDAVAEFVHTSKRFGEVLAADRLNLRIRRGEFLSFLGPSGCGKTTALRMLAGFETPSSGQILLDGREVEDLPPYRRPVNMVFQHYALFPHMSVAENIGYGLRQRRPRLSRDEIAARVGRALSTVRLDGFAGRRIWEMSGGQQQRVALARAIVNEPKLLLLDEPMAALDAKLRAEMQRELLDLQRSLGITFVLVTHDQEEALSMSDRIVIMGESRIVQVGSPQELYDRPVNRYVADFVGRANILPGEIVGREGAGAKVALPGGATVRVRLDHDETRPRVELAVRPEVLTLAGLDAPVPAGAAALPAIVTHRTFLGDHTEYLLRSETLGPLQVLVPRRAERAEGGHDVGAAVHVIWASGSGLVLGPGD